LSIDRGRTLKIKRWLPLLLLSSSSLTFALSGEELYHYCADNACGGYFIGAFDGLLIAGAVGDARRQKSAMICAPDAIDGETIVQVALDYIERHPETRHLSAANLALRAWREQWPCSKH
jgi:hypothetical protein